MLKKFVIVISVSVLALLLILLFIPEDKVYIKYKDFVTNVELKKVETVDIQEDYLYFKNFDDNTKYYTENPDAQDLKEYLLLNDITIENSFGASDVEFILDILFYVLFFGVAILGGYKLISFSSKNFKVIKNNKTKFSDIAGMEDIKKDMMNTVDILKNPEKYRAKGIRPPKGIILEGPPGNGKTLFARALAGEANINFIPTKGADFQSAMMSIGPRKIKSLFKKARKNKPCIIFIDEFDGIGERRNYAGTGIDKENNRIIIAMLNEMDGFTNEDGILVIAATNSFEALDGALIRPGRFDKKFKVGNPDKDTILKLIEMYTSKKHLDSKINKESLAKCFDKLSCAAIETILNESEVIAETNGRDEIIMEDIVEAGKKTNTVNIKISKT